MGVRAFVSALHSFAAQAWAINSAELLAPVASDAVTRMSHTNWGKSSVYLLVFS